ncbi:MAG: beta strand repeat-containing protein [Planctomycetota bacterium]
MPDLRTVVPAVAFAILLLVVVPATVATAASANWTGAVDLDWSNAGNWTAGGPPGAGDTATFDTASAAGLTNVPAALGGLSVSAGVSVTITSLAAGAELVIDGGGIDLEATGALTVAAGVTVSVTNSGDVADVNALFINDGSSLIVAGRLNVGTPGNEMMFIRCDPGATFTVGSLGCGGVYLSNIGATLTECTMTITTGGIVYIGDDVTLDGYEYLSSTSNGNDNTFRILLTGNIDFATSTNCYLFANMVNFEINGDVTLTGGVNAINEEMSLGSLIVGAGESFTLDPVLANQNSFSLHDLDNEGTVDLGAQNLYLGGARFAGVPAVIHNGTAATLTMTGNVVATNYFVLDRNLQLDGTISFPGTFALNNMDVVVTHGSTVTFNGDVTVAAPNLPSLGAAEDGATATGFSTLVFNAKLTIRAAGGLRVGEGHFYLAGDIDLGGTTNAVNTVLPPQNSNNDEEPEVHLTGGAQAISAATTGAGSLFAVTSVAAATRVTQTGILTIVGAFDTSGATGVTPFDVWSTTSATFFGSTQFGADTTMVLGDGDVAVNNTLQVQEVHNGDPSQHNDVTISSTGVGRFRVLGLSVNGDTFDDDAGADANAATLVATGVHFVIGNGTTGFFRTQSGAIALQSNGAQVTLTGCTMEINALADFTVAGASGGSAANTGRLELTTCTVTFAATSQLSIGEDATFIATGSSLTSPGAWNINPVATASAVTTLTNCTVSGGSPGDLDITLYSAALSLSGVAFSNYDATGVQCEGDIVTINDCTFSGGITDATHITFTNIYVGVDRNFDNNTFDNSVNVVIGNGAANGELVHGSGPFIFRVAGNDFGIGGFNITAAQAEADGDLDGTVVDQDVRWDGTLASLAVSSSAGNLATANGITDSSEYTVLDITFTPALVSATLSDLAVTVSCSGDLDTATDIAQVNLYYDADASGTFELLEQLSSMAPGSDTITFTSLGVAMASGVGSRFGVGIVFQAAASGKAGTVTASLQPGALTLSGNSHLTTGLPVSHAAVFTGPASQLAMITQPAGTFFNTALTTQPVIELRDAGGNRVLADSTTQLTASINSGPGGSTLGGTVTVTASTGRVTFADLSVSAAGTYVLTFDDGVVVLTINSASFNTTTDGAGGGGGGGGGGCSAGGDDRRATAWMPWLLALLLLVGLRGASQLRIFLRRG